jgi:Fur family transcriptional regulator, ferric uptake regulator
VPTAHHTREIVVDDVDEAIVALRAQGLRVSAARRVLLEGLFGASAPITAEELAAGSQRGVPASDVASVYRNLELFERVGLVRHSHLGHGPAVYALATRLAPAYLICERCGRTTALGEEELEPLRRSIRERFGHRAHFRHFPVTGVCAHCATETDE